jgi:hypothetical protein
LAIFNYPNSSNKKTDTPSWFIEVQEFPGRGFSTWPHRLHACRYRKFGTGAFKDMNVAFYSYSSVIITPYERNSSSAGIGKYLAENITMIDFAVNIFPSNLP